MSLEEFTSSLSGQSPPAKLPALLKALWHDTKGDWQKAHETAQDVDSKAGAWVHAYLHRKEGDLTNASYWYGQAGKTLNRSSLEEEWREIVSSLLQDKE